MKKLMLGNESVARGLYEAGVRFISSYPGTPSTEITEFTSTYSEMYSEWAPNEKVAFEAALGAAVGGGRSFCGMKHVGLNVAADPLFVAGYTGIVGGMVVGVADDPGIENYAISYTTAYPARAEGANVWVVNPDSSYGQSLEGYGDLKMVESKKEGVIYSLDLSSAYEGYVESALRGFMLSDDRTVFTVQDEIQPFKGENEFYWFWHTLADITINENSNSVVLARNGVLCKIYFDSNVDFTITKQDVLTSLPESPKVEGQNQEPHAANMHKIVVTFKSNGEPITFRATAAPFNKTIDKDTLTPIDEWTIPGA